MPGFSSYSPFGNIVDHGSLSDILISERYPQPASADSVIVNSPSPAPNHAMIFFAKQAVSSFIKAVTLAEG